MSCYTRDEIYYERRILSARKLSLRSAGKFIREKMAASPIGFTGRFVLLGDLHANSKDYAVCLEEAGAEAVFFHLNHDTGAGGRFGGLEIEEDSIKDALSTLRIPAGVTVGDVRVLQIEEWESIVKLGFSYVNMLAHQMPIFAWRDPRIAKIVSIGPGYILEQVKGISELEDVQAIIASLTPNQGFGMPLTMLDVTTLKLVSRLSEKPVLVPTQRMIAPRDLRTLKEAGCSGAVLSSTVYGDTLESCRECFSRFKAESAAESPQIIP